MSRPSFQWYPDDWMTDGGLRLCSPATRGIWMDLLCRMHQGEPYGHLAGPTGTLPIKMLSSWCHVPHKEFLKAIGELEKNKVFDRTPNGVIYSRRMVRDEHNRIVRGNGGGKSQRNPSVPRPKDTFKDTFMGLPKNNHKGYTQEDEDVVVSNSLISGKVLPGEVRTFAIDLNGATSQRFEDWWAIWSKVRGSYNKLAACQAYLSVVSQEIESACFECTESYLASIEGNRGFNPDNFLFTQAREGFTSRWIPRKKSRGETLSDMEREAEEIDRRNNPNAS